MNPSDFSHEEAGHLPGCKTEPTKYDGIVIELCAEGCPHLERARAKARRAVEALDDPYTRGGCPRLDS